MHTFVYLNDILIVFRSFEEHVQHLHDVFQRLQEARPQAKCHLLHDKVPFLDHIMSTTGEQPDPVNIKKVKHYPTLINATQV